MPKRIVITGEGIVSAIGLNLKEIVDSLLHGISGIGEIKYLNSVHKELPVAEVKMSNEQMKTVLGINPNKLISRTALMGMMAVRQALENASVVKNDDGKSKTILVSGTTVGGMDLTEQFYENMDSKEWKECVKQHDCGSSTKTIADFFTVFNDCTTVSTACSSAANAIAFGAELIKSGQADIVVAGGTEALSKFHLNGFNALMILDNNRCKPFDAERAGLNLGEGAAFVVLESEEHAKERDADIHAFLSGYGNACDAYHQTASSSDGEGAFLAMTKALVMANLKPEDVDYVNAHGTGTPNNDASESVALRRVFKENMPNVSSTKGFTGHATSAAGAIETVISILAMREGFVPANLGWNNQMDNGITPSMGIRECELKNVMCNSFGFGGNDTSLILSKIPSVCLHERNNPSGDIRILSKVVIDNEGQLAEIKSYVKPLEARRMGKIMKSSLLSSMKALEEAGIQCPDAIITATSMGCLQNSELLLNQMMEEGETSLKPTYFMQSTHNTIGSNIAIKIGCHGYNITYTHGDDSLEWAMRDAEMLLKSGKCKYVLVGRHDETTPMYRSVMKRLGKENLLDINSIAMILTCGE